MKLKSYCALIPLLFALIFASCNDDLNNIGGTIQPPSDSISVSLDTLSANARTISMRDSVYARTINGALGKYDDKLFGSIKADYLAQFMFPEGAKFEDNLTTIDSVHFVINYNKFSGDTLAPMGLSVYEVNKPLVENFYTNADPSKYCDLSKVLVNQAFTISGSRILSGGQRAIVADLNKEFGYKLNQAYKDKKIHDSESFNEYFKGVYVTTTFGSTSLINVSKTDLNIYYKYNDIKGNYNNTKDTIRSARFSLTVTPEVIQLNHIQNTNPKELFVEGTGSTYLKTPAGVYTEVVFPIKDIRADLARLNMQTVNSAQFLVNGNTQSENSLSTLMDRPSTVLLIDRDSIDDFFKYRNNKVTGVGSFTTSRDVKYNTYNFKNIANLINHYNAKGVDQITFVLIPVDISTDSSTGAVLGIYNTLTPSNAILRSDPSNMKLNLIYTKFNSPNI